MRYTTQLGAKNVEVVFVQSQDEISEMRAALVEGDIYGLDVETTRLTDLFQWDPEFRVRLVQIATLDTAYVFDMSNDKASTEALRILQSDVQFCSHTPMDVLSVYTQFDIDLTSRNFDTRMLAAMASPDDSLGGNDLKTLTQKYLGPELKNAEAVLSREFKELYVANFIGKPGDAKAKIDEYGWANTPAANTKYVTYAGMDAIACRQLLDLLLIETKAPKQLLQKEFWLAGEAVRAQIRGMRLDYSAFDELHIEAESACSEAEKLILERSGALARSPKLAVWLEKHGADFSEFPKTPKGSPSLTRSNLEIHEILGLNEDTNSVVELLRNFKSHQDALTKTAGIKNATIGGQVHPRLTTIGAITGRMSSAAPNFQNFSKAEPRMRGLFIPKPNYTFITADFDQIELRVIAALAREQKMIDVILSGGDLHALTASEVGVTRTVAKMTNFLIVYGGGAKALAEKAHIPYDEAKRAVTTFREQYKGIDTYAKKLAKRLDFVRTVTGRKLPVTTNSVGDKRTYANVNYVVQSSARDILVHSWYRFVHEYNRANYIWFPIHDELVLQVPNDEVELVKKEIEDCMTMNFMGVPITASAVVLLDDNGVSRWMSSSNATEIAERRTGGVLIA